MTKLNGICDEEFYEVVVELFQMYDREEEAGVAVLDSQGQGGSR